MCSILRSVRALALGIVGGFLLIGAVAISSDAPEANASGWPCEPPSLSGGGPCLAHFYGVNMVATFTVPYPVIVQWNFDSQVLFYGYPQTGHAVEVIHMQHAVWTTQDWPPGEVFAVQATWIEGYILNSGCWPSCTLLGMPIGPDYRSPYDFDHQRTFSNLFIVSDGATKARASAGVSPVGGFSSAYNHTRNECKHLSADGAFGC